MASTLRRNTRRTLALTLFVAGIAAAAFAEPVAKVKANGASLSVYGSDASGCIWFGVSAWKTGTTAAPQTFLYYDVYDQCAAQSIAWGYGSIANTAFKVAGKTASLVVTPSAGSDFYTEGATGSIRLTLKADGLRFDSFSGHSRSEYAGHVYQSHGAWTSRSAAVTGTILGYAAENLLGSFGDSRDRYIEIDRGPK